MLEGESGGMLHGKYTTRSLYFVPLSFPFLVIIIIIFCRILLLFFVIIFCRSLQTVGFVFMLKSPDRSVRNMFVDND